MPKVGGVRPTQDKVRQAVFNMLGGLSGMRVLDLFAGSGAFGIEALSRGAGHVVFIDDNAKCTGTIRANLGSLGIQSLYYDIITETALSGISRLEKSGKCFDIIFLDPPYHKDLARKSLINIDSCDILAPTGLMVAERSRDDELPEFFETLMPLKEKRYGDTIINIYRKEKWVKPR
jgi:16S rRNA (guanine(966)-N(2))-methyltransferase RsmD